MKWLSACVEVCQKNTVMFVWIQSGPNRNHWDGNNPDRILNHTHTVRIYDLAVALTLCRQYTTWLIKAHSNTSTYVHVLYISMYCDKYKVLFHCAPDKQGRGGGGVNIFSTGIFSLYYKVFWCDSWLRRKTPLVHQFLVRWRHQSFLDIDKHSTVFYYYIVYSLGVGRVKVSLLTGELGAAVFVVGEGRCLIYVTKNVYTTLLTQGLHKYTAHVM